MSIAYIRQGIDVGPAVRLVARRRRARQRVGRPQCHGRKAHHDDEVFGPVVGLAHIDSLKTGIQLANATEFGMQAGVFTADYAAALRASDAPSFAAATLDEASGFRVDNMPYGRFPGPRARRGRVCDVRAPSSSCSCCADDRGRCRTRASVASNRSSASLVVPPISKHSPVEEL